MPMTQEEMVKLLKKYGFTLCKGGKGSHVKMKKPGQKRPIIIPKGELNKFTEKGILKDGIIIKILNFKKVYIKINIVFYCNIISPFRNRQCLFY